MAEFTSAVPGQGASAPPVYGAGGAGAAPQYDPYQYGLQLDAAFTREAAEELHNLFEMNSVREIFSKRVKYVQGKKVILLLDDSGSMGLASDDSLRAMPADDVAEYRNMTTISRYIELKAFVRVALKVYGSLSHDGVDVWFLNRPPVFGVKVWSQLEATMEQPPRGGTPLREQLEAIYGRYASGEVPVLINCVTDGVPNGGIPRLMEVLKRMPRHITLNIRLCVDETADPHVVEAYGAIDKGVPRVDVNDSYGDEKGEVRKAKGINMSWMEYFLKATIGAADRTEGADDFDRWDEGGGCCTIM